MKCSLTIVAVIVLLFATPCTAQDGITPKGGVRARAARVGRLIDHYVKAEMQRQRIPGLALAVIKGGEIILAKGYGFANVELQVPVEPETVFQSGSVGQQFTATAVM